MNITTWTEIISGTTSTADIASLTTFLKPSFLFIAAGVLAIGVIGWVLSHIIRAVMHH